MLAGPDEAAHVPPVVTIDLHVTDDLSALMFTASDASTSASANAGLEISGTELNSNFGLALTGRNYLTVIDSAYHYADGANQDFGTSNRDQLMLANDPIHSTLTLPSGAMIPAVVIIPDLGESLGDAAWITRPSFEVRVSQDSGREIRGDDIANGSRDAAFIVVDRDSLHDSLTWTAPEPLPLTPGITTIDVPDPIGPFPVRSPKIGKSMPEIESFAGEAENDPFASQPIVDSPGFAQGEGEPLLLATSNQIIPDGDARALNSLPQIPPGDVVDFMVAQGPHDSTGTALNLDPNTTRGVNGKMNPNASVEMHQQVAGQIFSTTATTSHANLNTSARDSFATHRVTIQHSEVSLAFEFSTEGIGSIENEVQRSASGEVEASSESVIQPTSESLSITEPQGGKDLVASRSIAHRAASLAGTPTVLLVVGTLWTRMRGRTNPKPRLNRRSMRTKRSQLDRSQD